MFLEHQKGDLNSYVQTIQAACIKQEKKSRSIKIAKLFEPLLRTMNVHLPAVQTMIQADPTPSALILGGIVCIMQISSKFIEYQGKVAKFLSRLELKVHVLSEFSEYVYRTDSSVQTALTEVYGDILDFCREALKLFVDDKGKERGGLKTFSHSLWQGYQMKLEAIVEKFNEDLEHFEDRARVCDRMREEYFRAIQYQFMQQQHQNHEDVVGFFSIGRDMLAQGSQRQIEADLKRMKGERARRGQ
jgi:hypothetical protein